MKCDEDSSLPKGEVCFLPRGDTEEIMKMKAGLLRINLPLQREEPFYQKFQNMQKISKLYTEDSSLFKPLPLRPGKGHNSYVCLRIYRKSQ